MRRAIASILRKCLHPLGLEIVRASSLASRTIPTCHQRLRHAKSLGFSPTVIVDAGAFNGTWTLQTASIFPDAHYFLIEPNPSLRGRLESQFATRGISTDVVNVAVGASSGKRHLNIWAESSTDAGASLLDHVSGPARSSVEVEVETIDNISRRFSRKPDLIKLDLQGTELSALQGATASLKHSEMVIVEFGCLSAYLDRTSPQELLQFMSDHDFRLYDIVDLLYRPYDGAFAGGDFFFVKNSSRLSEYQGWS